MKLATFPQACGCCNAISELTVGSSRMIGKVNWDMKPEYKYALPYFSECPGCHYCAIDITKKADAITQVLVESEQYKKLATLFTDEYERKINECILLAESDRKKADLYMIYAWYLEFEGQEARAIELRRKASDIQVGLVEMRDDPELTIQVIDNLRQLSKFQAAWDLLTRAEAFFGNSLDDNLKKLMQSEKSAISQGDSAQHQIVF